LISRLADWSPLFLIVVVAVLIVLATSIIASIFSSVVTLVVAVITLVVVTPVTSVIAMVVAASVIAAIVAAIITSIPVIIVRIGSVFTVITSIRPTTIAEALAAVPVVVVVALGLLGVRRYPKGMLQLLVLPHGMLGIAMKLALVVHDHVEVTFKEGGGSWWIFHIDFTRSLV
jgi:hypothetical protein